MVEENFGIRGSEMVQNEGFFRHYFEKKASPWLKKILKFKGLKCSRMKDFLDIILVRKLHHGLKKILKLEFLKGSRMNGSMVSGADMDK